MNQASDNEHAPTDAMQPAPPLTATAGPPTRVRQVVFVLAAVGVLIPWQFSSPQLALALGIVLALAGLTAFEKESQRLSRL